MASAPFPGEIIKVGSADAAAVRAIQGRLTAAGYGAFTDGVFDEAMKSKVSLYQAQHLDSAGHPLRADGEVGPLTWAALFFDGAAPAPNPVNAGGGLLLQAVAVARSQIGVLEVPPGSNRGPQVDQYLNSVGIAPNQGTTDQRYWCAAFVYWCFQQAATTLGTNTPLVRTAGVLDHWNRADRAKRVTVAAVRQNPSLVQPGWIFIQDHGSGAGHTGIVERLDGGRLWTVEGNINNDPTPGRNGIGAFETDRRTIMDPQLVGFLNYA